MFRRFLLIGFVVFFTAAGAHAIGDARSKVQFAAVSSGTVAFPWPSSGKPQISFPFNERNRPVGLVVFEGKTYPESGGGDVVIGGTLLVQRNDGKKAVVRDAWTLSLIEVGLIDTTGWGDDAIYYVSAGGNTYETWNFYLYNPQKSALVSLSYGWSKRDLKVERKTSDNFEKSKFKAEREFLEAVSQSEAYKIPRVD